MAVLCFDAFKNTLLILKKNKKIFVLGQITEAHFTKSAGKRSRSIEGHP
jgi:hypothetical protein